MVSDFLPHDEGSPVNDALDGGVHLGFQRCIL